MAKKSVSEIRSCQRANGPATMLAIGVANPANCVSQDDFADYYFRITKSEHLTDLKATFNKICRLTGMKKRYFHHTEQLLNAHPEFLDGKAPSLDARLDIVAVAAPELAAAAAAKAIAKWGRPATDITHLIVSTNSGAHAPGADHRLAALLGLRPDVCRTMLQLNGCTAGCAVMRLSKDIAENNRDARVLVACVELTLTSFRGPDEEDTFETLINQGLFSDGAGAVIVGADPVAGERPLFEMVSATQTVVPGTEDVINMQLGKSGVRGNMSTKLPVLAADNVEKCLAEAFGRLGVAVEWNHLFWAVHAGSQLILDNMDKILHCIFLLSESSLHVRINNLDCVNPPAHQRRHATVYGRTRRQSRRLCWRARPCRESKRGRGPALAASSSTGGRVKPEPAWGTGYHSGDATSSTAGYVKPEPAWGADYDVKPEPGGDEIVVNPEPGNSAIWVSSPLHLYDPSNESTAAQLKLSVAEAGIVVVDFDDDRRVDRPTQINRRLDTPVFV